MVKVFEQGALDSLYAAQRAITKAIAAYEQCKEQKELSLDGGPLFAALDHTDTAQRELLDFTSIAKS